MCAEKRGESIDQLIESVLATGGPVFAGTKAANVGLHDDKSQYTGVYAKGGPSTADGKISDISSLCDRSAADVRGRKV